MVPFHLDNLVRLFVLFDSSQYSFHDWRGVMVGAAISMQESFSGVPALIAAAT
jgi:hypothetical protein